MRWEKHSRVCEYLLDDEGGVLAHIHKRNGRWHSSTSEFTFLFRWVCKMHVKWWTKQRL